MNKLFTLERIAILKSHKLSQRPWRPRQVRGLCKVATYGEVEDRLTEPRDLVRTCCEALEMAKMEIRVLAGRAIIAVICEVSIRVSRRDTSPPQRVHIVVPKTSTLKCHRPAEPLLIRHSPCYASPS